MTKKKNYKYLGILDEAVNNSKKIISLSMPSDIYWTTLDFTDPSLSSIINTISSKLNYFKGTFLFTNSSNRDAKNLLVDGRSSDYIWTGNLANINKTDTIDENLNHSNIHTIYKWDLSQESDSKFKKTEVSGNKKEPEEKGGYSEKLKEKFKTKEDYETYLKKVKSQSETKKSDYGDKEKSLKEKFKTKEDYETYLKKVKSQSDSFKDGYSKKGSSEKTEMKILETDEVIEKGKVGFWKNHNGKKKYMKDHQIKLKDKDGKDVIGDFKISKEGKVDLTGLKAGKYSAKIKIGSDETLLSKVKSSINIDDVMSIINHIGKVKFLSDKEIVAGNITRPETNDDKVDIDDVMSILKIIGGLKKVDQLEVREANQTNSSSEYIDVSSGESPALECFLLGDVDGSFSTTII